jgi:hypothetical protein
MMAPCQRQIYSNFRACEMEPRWQVMARSVGDRSAVFGSDQRKCGHAHLVRSSRLTQTKRNQVPPLALRVVAGGAYCFAQVKLAAWLGSPRPS